MGSSIAASLAGGGGGGSSTNPLGNPNSSFWTGGMGQAIQQLLGPSQAQMQASAAGTNTSDPNNMSATGIGSSNIVQSNMIPPTPGMSEVGVPPTISSAVGNIPPVTTGSFTPQSQYVAEGIYGDKRARQASVTKKPLINIL
jgi:hypothetical protein